MARQRITNPADAVDESDAGAAAGAVPELPEAPVPVAAGHLRVHINARRNGNPDPKSDGVWPPGNYDLPIDEAKHYIASGVAKLVV